MAADDRSGWARHSSVSAAGDVNGDGLGDLLIGAWHADPHGTDSGSSYVVFGRASGFAAMLPLSALNGTNGFRLDGVATGDYSGLSVSAAGDVNGDGFDDLIVGAWGADPNGEQSGSSYVVFGKAGAFGVTVDLSALDGASGFRLDGAAGDHSGLSVSAAGDVNSDGFADLLIGSVADPNGKHEGSSYVVFGHAGEFDPVVPLSDLNGTNGFRLDGGAFDYSSRAVAAAGDVNGDGFADVIIGASLAHTNGTRSGASYVVFGKASGFQANLPLSTLNGTNGFRLDGAAERDYSGSSVSAAGDINGDGFDDLLVGAFGADTNGDGSGSSYLVFGQASGFAPTLSLSALNGTNGFRLDGAVEGDYAGSSVSAAGDVDGDGFDDLIIGARNADPNGAYSGSSYVVFGGNFTGAVTKLGTAVADRLIGTAAAERFVGGQGNDLLDGRGGVDGFEGGAGNDRIRISDLAFHSVDGGSGEDTLILNGRGLTLDLAARRGQLEGIERLDLSGTGDNRVVLNALDVLSLSDSSNRLIVSGDVGDRCVFQDGGWVAGPTVALGDVSYQAYHQGQAEVLVDPDLLTVHPFSALSNEQVLAFDPEVDVLHFDRPGWDAGALTIAAAPAPVRLSLGGKTVQLDGISLSQLSGMHVTFANGSALRLGDDTVSFLQDRVSNTLLGGTGNDYLDGLGGADVLRGGVGDDTYGVDRATDRVQEAADAGFDTVLSTVSYTLPAQVEALRLLGTGAVDGTGNGLDNVLYASVGDNVLAGGAGVDTVSYQYAATAGVTVSLASVTGQATGGSGTDRLRGFENLVGSPYADVLTGNAGANVLDGGAGVDVLRGGAGDDTYGVDRATDRVQEAADAGFDTVLSTASYILPANVEALRLLGARALKGTGNGQDNVLYASLGDNVLDGGAGIDTVSYQYGATAAVRVSLATTAAQATGGSGMDTLTGFERLTGTRYGDVLTGNAGANVLDGSGGADVLRGGGGNDVLVVRDLTFRTLDGGAGTDTVRFLGDGLTVDLNTLGAKLTGIEVLDLAGTGHVVLDAAAVTGLSDTTDRLRIEGGAGAVVEAGSGWVPGLAVEQGGERYHTYTQGTAELWLSEAIGTVNIPPAAVRSLEDLNRANGFRLDGVAEGDRSGRSVSAAGDVNGDGFDDLIIGAPYADLNSDDSGSSYVVFGQASEFAAMLELSALNGTNGFRLDGAAEGDYAGWSVSGAGDVNGDGFDDLIIGALGADLNGAESGSSYVVFGRALGFAPALPLSALDGTNGFRLDGAAAGDASGYSVSAAGDVDGDGFDDLIIGARNADPNGDDSGSSYVVFGRASGFAPALPLSALDGTNGFRLDGADAYDSAGVSVSAAGDVNGDGFDDLLIGANGADPRGSGAGSSYVVFGWASGFAATLQLSALNGRNGFRLDGIAARDGSGYSVSAAGDVNGDGFDDLLIGAPHADPNGDGSGSSYVVFGQASGFGATLRLSALDGTNGFRLAGAAAGDYSGWSVSAAGDVNGDGFDDLLIGAAGAGPNGDGSGSSYVVFGQASGFAVTLPLSGLNGANGFRLDGAAHDFAGYSVSAAGDVNGDGFDDLLIGADGADPNGDDSGSSYVVFGGDFTGAVTKLGTAAADRLIGTAAAERFVGGQSADVLDGQGGADVLEGGAGDDLIRVADLSFHRVDGGSGPDTLALTGAGQTLDLAAVRGRLEGIERIDLTGTGDNSVLLNALDVLGLSDSSNRLIVDGNAGDHYAFQDAGWVAGPDVTVVGVAYHSYTHGQAQVLLDPDLLASA